MKRRRVQNHNGSTRIGQNAPKHVDRVNRLAKDDARQKRGDLVIIAITMILVDSVSHASVSHVQIGSMVIGPNAHVVAMVDA